MARLFQRGAKVRVIENFTVVCDPQVAVFVGHRLVAACDIDDAKPALADVRERVVIVAEIVRAAMPDCIGHAGKQGLTAVGRRGGDKPCDPTHIYI